ncbi:MAG: GIY-YIG nuclease family protein [Candidatus Zambryskibacteria bacterium]|nr:GIY-YIG nuclease family protein [Candidatus Zambryskibacteria bacterium]
MYYTYVLKSEIDSKLYIGWTDNLRNRLAKHNNGQVPATASRKPLKLLYYEACMNKNHAIAREKYFKTGYGRSFLKLRI